MSEESSSELPNRIAARVLADALGGAVRLGEAERLGGTRDRSSVWRVPVLDGPPDAPATVIVKRSIGDEGSASDGSDRRRFAAEWGSYRFLAGVAPASPLWARFYGAEPAELAVVLEDLGAGASLADALTGDDPAAAERALLAYAGGLGRLHAATAGRLAEFSAARRAAGADPSTDFDENLRADAWEAEYVAPFLAACEALGVRAAPGFGHEARAVVHAMRSPGPLDAFTPGDTCPDNHLFVGGRPRFFDFEFSAFRPALLDAAYFRVPFPTCWCVSRVPGDLAARMDDAYRAAAAPALPALADEAFYRREMAHALACWLLVTLGFLPFAGLHLEGALAEDKPWGPVSLRQRHVHRLESFAAAAEAWGHLPALAETARALAARLRERWQGAEMPAYPAFRR